MSKIQYDSTVEAAFQQVFGNTIICPNLTIASQYARNHGCHGVTPDGDTTNKRGAMTGGYIDTRKSRLEAVRAVNKWRDEFDTLQQKGNDIRRQIEKKDQEITNALGELRKLEQKLRQMEDGYGPLLAELNSKNVQIDRERDRLENANKRRENVDRNMKEFENALSAYEAELASDFKKALSASEEKQLETLSSSVQELQREWNEVSASRRELDSKKRILEHDLRHNLQLKLDQLTSQAFETASGSGSSLKEAKRELKKAQAAVAMIKSKLEENSQQIDAAETQVSNLEKQKAQKDDVKHL